MIDKKNRDNLLWGVVVLLMVVTLGVVYYKYKDYFSPKADVAYPFDAQCELKAGPCETALKEGASVSFSILPRTIPLLKPLDLEVHVNGMEVYKVEVDFAGVDMNMGFNRNSLSVKEPGLYTGQATLPVCVRSRMDWEAKVMLYTADSLITVPFRFETVK